MMSQNCLYSPLNDGGKQIFAAGFLIILHSHIYFLIIIQRCNAASVDPVSVNVDIEQTYKIKLHLLIPVDHI